MLIQIVSAVLAVIYVYLAIGLFVGAAIVSLGLERVDNETSGSGFGFRFVILPGVIALWPLLLSRMIRGGGEPPVQTDPHR